MEQLSNHHVGGALVSREAWNRLSTQVPLVDDYVVYKKENDDAEGVCVENGNRHPWLVGLVLKVLATSEEAATAGYYGNNDLLPFFIVHEMGRPVEDEVDTFSEKNRYYLRYQTTEGKGENEKTLDVYKTDKVSASILKKATPVTSLITFESLAWWNTKGKVLTVKSKLRDEVLKELDAQVRIEWKRGYT